MSLRRLRSRDRRCPATRTCILEGWRSNVASERPQRPATVTAPLRRWAGWLDELEAHPLDFYEYEALLLHREVLQDELEIAGDEASFAEADALDARFDELTVVVLDSPFAAGSGEGSIRGELRRGRWWSRLPADAQSLSYTLMR
jgi:hypothetical protein